MITQDWIISVEKKLTAIHKDIGYITQRLPLVDCAQMNSKVKALNSKIKTNRWVMGILFIGIISLLVGIIAKI